MAARPTEARNCPKIQTINHLHDKFIVLSFGACSEWRGF
jgi:hypothetical protein